MHIEYLGQVELLDWIQDEMSNIDVANEACRLEDGKFNGANSFGDGYLVPLKTTLETTARDTIIDVYVTIIPIKQASNTLK